MQERPVMPVTVESIIILLIQSLPICLTIPDTPSMNLPVAWRTKRHQISQLLHKHPLIRQVMNFESVIVTAYLAAITISTVDLVLLVSP